MRSLTIIVGLILISILLPKPSAGQAVAGYSGDFDRSDVRVMVETDNGWGGHSISGLGCDGIIMIVGAKNDTTSIPAAVSPDSALAIINELLAMDFLGQPKDFHPVRGEFIPTADGRISMFSRRAYDAGYSKITLFLGSRAHSVKLHFPAYGASEALIDWERRFRDLVKGQVGK